MIEERKKGECKTTKISSSSFLSENINLFVCAQNYTC